jgi:hypothetical protein
MHFQEPVKLYITHLFPLDDSRDACGLLTLKCNTVKLQQEKLCWSALLQVMAEFVLALNTIVHFLVNIHF